MLILFAQSQIVNIKQTTKYLLFSKIHTTEI